MTPCVQTILVVTRILCIVGLLLVILAFIQRDRLEKFLLARANKPMVHPKRRFWIFVAAGAMVFISQALFVERCTGFHLPLMLRLVVGFVAFALFVGLTAFEFFVSPRQFARDPQRAVRRGFVLLGLAGIFFIAAL